MQILQVNIEGTVDTLVEFTNVCLCPVNPLISLNKLILTKKQNSLQQSATQMFLYNKNDCRFLYVEVFKQKLYKTLSFKKCYLLK